MSCFLAICPSSCGVLKQSQFLERIFTKIGTFLKRRETRDKLLKIGASGHLTLGFFVQCCQKYVIPVVGGLWVTHHSDTLLLDDGCWGTPIWRWPEWPEAGSSAEEGESKPWATREPSVGRVRRRMRGLLWVLTHRDLPQLIPSFLWRS